MTTIPGPQSAEILRRLRAWNVSSWRHGSRVTDARDALQELAGLAAAHDGTQRPRVPDAGVHALADQLTVLRSDALSAGAAPALVDAVLTTLARRVGLLR